MHVLFVHHLFPGQFGPIARYLTKDKLCRCTFVTPRPPGKEGGIELIQYKPQGQPSPTAPLPSRYFEDAVWRAHAVYLALEPRKDLHPDLIVGHGGFGTTVYLRELYNCPIINYFEYFYRLGGGIEALRPEWGPDRTRRTVARAANAMPLLDLENCDLGYTPTAWQKSQAPERYHDKLEVAFDGIDTNLWKREPEPKRELGGRPLPEGCKVISYVSRGLESTRGFDQFMRTAKRIAERRSDVVFVVVGAPESLYHDDTRITGGAPFKDWVLAQDAYDLSRFWFLGVIPPRELLHVLSLADVHLYWTAPFIVSWSLLDALACGTPVVASRTDPVGEFIENDQNGLLVDYFDEEAFAAAALRLLDDRPTANRLGAEARRRIEQHYSLAACLPRQLEVYMRGCERFGTFWRH